MSRSPTRAFGSWFTLCAFAAVLLTGCGGGGGDDPATTATRLTCNTAGYVAGSVELPTSAQLAARAGTYTGDEGSYGPNPNDPFVRSGPATLVVAADGGITYKGVAYTPSSVCIDKVAGPYGQLLYFVVDPGHLDVAATADPSLGQAWGVSPADGTTIFTNGRLP